MRQSIGVSQPIAYSRRIADTPAIVPRFLSEEACRALVAQVQSLGAVHTEIGLQSQWRGDTRWGRNRVSVASDWRNNELWFGAWGIDFNQIDTESLRSMIQLHLRERQILPEKGLYDRDITVIPSPRVYPKTHIWSDRTYAQTSDERATVAAQLIDGAERAGMLSAGYLSVEASGNTLYTKDGRFLYAPRTLAQCSITVRDPKGTGSGWAGASSYDWGRFDAAKLAEIALDKCLRSRNPVRIEPGRYTLIMEPQATFDFVSVLLRDGLPQFMRREATEKTIIDGSLMPFKANRKISYQIGQYSGSSEWDQTRIGEKIVDERVSITFDPIDPDLGILPFTNEGEPYQPVTWIDKGVLANLSYEQDYAMQILHQPIGKPNSGAFRMDALGPAVSIDEMIATTKRGLVVTRFWDLHMLDQQSVLFTGFTRDGLWLIENGKISHPVQNLRFTESPLFALNNVEQWGVPVPVFSPGLPAVVPLLKVRDFSFTSLIDAV